MDIGLHKLNIELILTVPSVGTCNLYMSSVDGQRLPMKGLLVVITKEKSQPNTVHINITTVLQLWFH